jgi:hypothetical protein
METISMDADSYLRRCNVCKKEEILPRAGKLWIGTSVKAEGKRDFERREFAKDLLQPKDRRGKIDELYSHAWGNPYQKSKIGTKVDDYKVKPKKRK